MKACLLLLLALVLALALGSSADAQAPEQAVLVGSWTLLTVDNQLPDGSRVHLYGERPQGLLIFLADGRYALQMVGADRPRFASGDKSRGTPDEYRAAVQGGNAHYGRYAVDLGHQVLTFHIEHASFSNWDGVIQQRPYALEGDTLRYWVPAPTSGSGAVGEVVWRRAGKFSNSQTGAHP